MLLRGICEDHPFEDGNKRAAYACAFTFIRLNGGRLVAGDDEIVTFMLEVARGERDLESIAEWVRARIENI